MERSQFEVFRERPEIPVLIAGGGINGTGLFRELALQGVDVLLVEKSDFCAGTSSASTRIIHGGLRYLENGEFRLVRESLRERNLLLRNAPHYVGPLPTTIPIFDWISGLVPAVRGFLGIETRPGNRGALLVKAGLALYDFLAGKESGLPGHRLRSRKSALAIRPALNPEVVSTATYYDAKITYPERLCLELAMDGEALFPQAHALNYVRVHEASGGTVVLRDEVSGERCAVRPRVVVNASGAWIDLTNRGLGRESRFIGGTKGSHIVLDSPELIEAAQGEMIYFINRDGRICIFYPFYGKIIAGTTDIPTDDPEALCDEQEVDYILESVRQVFPTVRVDRSQVVFRFCGVRPLPRSNALTPGQISRDHSFPVLAPADGIEFPIYSLVGGKWTTFRAFAEQVTDELLRVLGRRRIRDSANLAIGGGKEYPRAGDAFESWRDGMSKRTGLPVKRLDELIDRYGTRAEEVAGYLQAAPDKPLPHHSAYSRREIEFIVSREKVVHLDDLILRRTLMGLLGQVSRGLLDELAAIAAPMLEWSPEDASAEVARAARILKEAHGVALE